MRPIRRPIGYEQLPELAISVDVAVFARILSDLDLLLILRGVHPSFPGVLLQSIRVEGQWSHDAGLDRKRYRLDGVTLDFVGNSATQLAVMEQYLAGLARELKVPLPQSARPLPVRKTD